MTLILRFIPPSLPGEGGRGMRSITTGAGGDEYVYYQAGKGVGFASRSFSEGLGDEYMKNNADKGGREYCLYHQRLIKRLISRFISRFIRRG
jgi:hypothetical protein